MGLDEVSDDGGPHGGGGEGKKSLSSTSVSCSICLEFVTDIGERSWAKLQCGHQFHLDCIGSAFNSKGAMQCPNCRKIEKGQWNYASGGRSSSDFIEDWGHDEDPYDLSFSEMFGVQWCPLPGFSRLPFEEGEFSQTAYQDLMGQHAGFPEHTTVSSSSHQCPYVAYYGPLHSSSSSSVASVSEGPNFSNRWGVPFGPNEVQALQASYAFAAAMEPHYQGWEHHSMPFLATGSRMGASDQASTPYLDQRSPRATTDLTRAGTYVHPFVMSHSSVTRVGSSVTSSMVPPYLGSAARSRDRVQVYFQPPSTSPPMFYGTRRSNAQRGISQLVPPPSSSSDQAGGYYVVPSATYRQSFPEAENQSRFHGREREQHLESFSSNQIERDPNWNPLPAVSGPNSFRQRSPP